MKVCLRALFPFVLRLAGLVALGMAAACGGPEPGEPGPALAWNAARPGPPPGLQVGVEVADGYVVEGFAADPLLANPVALDVDDHGRVWIAETHRYQRSVLDITQQPAWLDDELALRTVADRDAFLRRTFAANPGLLTADSELLRVVVDDDGDGRADRSAVVAEGEGFNQPTAGTAAGVLVVGEDVFFASIPALWKLPAAAKLEQRVTPEVLQHGFGVHIGVTGHDLHGLTLGPDGRLWFSVGDRGAVLETAEGVRIELPDEGAVYRCELDGSDLEVYARGLRNPQELAFDDFGNLFTADNDTAGADRSRVIHVVRGGDYGWRCSYQHKSGFGPWVQEAIWAGSAVDDVLPHAGYGPQGPGGLAWHPGTGFAATERGRLVCCDFPKGVMTFGVEPAGASFQVVDPRFVIEGIWAPDACFGPDGALWLVDWIGGWGQPRAGAVHRVFAAGALGDPMVADVQRLLGEGCEGRPAAELIALLGHPDRRVRARAQTAIGKRILGDPAVRPALEALLGDAKAAELARYHALQALAARARSGMIAPLDVVPQLAAASPVLRAAALRLVDDGVECRSVAALESALGAVDPLVRAAAVEALGARARHDELAQARLIEHLRNGVDALIDGDPYLEHACVEAGRRGLSPQVLARFATMDSARARRIAARALRRQASPLVARFLDDPAPDVVSTAVRAIHDVPIEAGMPALADRFEAVPAGDRARALDALRRVGRPRDVARLAEIAADPSMAGSLRGAALDALAAWGDAAELDPVLGLWRPVPYAGVRVRETARVALQPLLEQLFTAESLEALPVGRVRTLIRAVVDLELGGAVDALGELALDSGREPLQRAAALRGLSRFALATELEQRLWQAVRGDDAPAELRVAALTALLRGPGRRPSAELVRWMDGLATDPDAGVAVRRAALQALADLEEPAGRESLRALLGDGLTAWPEALHLDVLEANAAAAARSTDGAQWAAEVERTRQRLGAAVYLAGGDPGRGGRIFAEDGRVQCQRCHAVAGVGGNLGPPLDAIGRELTGGQLVEALLEPMARVRDGYPPAMPPVAAQLPPADLRDLLAWLQQRRRD